MVDFSIGSIRDVVYSGISPFPISVSGVLDSLADNQVFFIDQFTGDSINTANIAEKYRPALTDLTTANVLKLMAVQDLGVDTVSIGELKTSNQNLMEMAKQFEDKGMFQLRSLSKGIKHKKVRG